MSVNVGATKCASLYVPGTVESSDRFDEKGSDDQFETPGAIGEKCDVNDDGRLDTRAALLLFSRLQHAEWYVRSYLERASFKDFQEWCLGDIEGARLSDADMILFIECQVDRNVMNRVQMQTLCQGLKDQGYGKEVIKYFHSRYNGPSCWEAFCCCFI